MSDEPIRAHIHTDKPTPGWTVIIGPTKVTNLETGEVSTVGEPMIVRESPPE